MTQFTKVHAFALATTMAIAFVLCAIFDLLFPPYGMLTALKPLSPFPLSGSPLALLIGLVVFTIVGFLIGGLYGSVAEFWNKRLR